MLDVTEAFLQPFLTIIQLRVVADVCDLLHRLFITSPSEGACEDANVQHNWTVPSGSLWHSVMYSAWLYDTVLSKL